MFKKGQQVVLVGDWDRKGTVYVVEALVHSCGKKQMVLTNRVTGEELGRHFRPDGQGWGPLFVVADEDYTDDLAVAYAFKITARERSERQSKLDAGQNIYWTEQLNRELSEIHEPRIIRE